MPAERTFKFRQAMTTLTPNSKNVHKASLMQVNRIVMAAATVAVLIAAGCGNSDSTYATDSNSGTGMSGVGKGRQVTGPHVAYGLTPESRIGEPPSFGTPTGTGFPTLDADQSGGMGSGMEGYHRLGAAGTSGAITDNSAPVDVQELGMSKSAAK